MDWRRIAVVSGVSLVLALAACSSTAATPSAGLTPSATANVGGNAALVASATPAPVAAKEWTLPLQDQAAGHAGVSVHCHGLVTLMAPGGWANVEQDLVSSQVGTIDAYCFPSELVLPTHPDQQWTLPALVATTWDHDQCKDEKLTTVSGQPAAVCSYTYDGSAFVYANLVVGDYFVEIGGQVATTAPADSAAMAEIIKTAVLTIS